MQAQGRRSLVAPRKALVLALASDGGLAQVAGLVLVPDRRLVS